MTLPAARDARAAAAWATRWAMIVAALAGSAWVLILAVRRIGGSSGEQVALSVFVTAALALGLEPARRTITPLADRLVYRRRLSPAQVLSTFGGGVCDLGSMARVLAGVTGADGAAIWLEVLGERAPAAWWPHSIAGPTARGTRIRDVRDEDGLVGTFTVWGAPERPATERESRLLDDLAAEAVHVLRNERLQRELARSAELIDAQAAALRESRRRVVQVHDEERRLLERNIHDGAQQDLVAMAAKIGLAKALVDTGPSRALAVIDELRGAGAAALATLRTLARETYPSTLAREGLGSALRLCAPQVDVADQTRSRAARDVEIAVYFCCREAIQNALKHASASRIDVRLWAQDGGLSFAIADDGRGFGPLPDRPDGGLATMRDRVESVGGRLEIRSAAGRGTTVEGSVP